MYCVTAVLVQGTPTVEQLSDSAHATEELEAEWRAALEAAVAQLKAGKKPVTLLTDLLYLNLHYFCDRVATSTCFPAALRILSIISK